MSTEQNVTGATEGTNFSFNFYFNFSSSMWSRGYHSRQCRSKLIMVLTPFSSLAVGLRIGSLSYLKGRLGRTTLI